MLDNRTTAHRLTATYTAPLLLTALLLTAACWHFPSNPSGDVPVTAVSANPVVER